MHELAFGITSQNPHFGPVLNPHDPLCIPGGSSGGSATAVAQGFLPLAWGTDTGGSIRIPASYCGVVGIKPTYGGVSARGVLPLAWSLDHVGPIASCVQDCALALRCKIEPKQDLRGVRVGVPGNFFFDHVDGEISTAVEKRIVAMERLGARICGVQVPDLHEANAAARIVQWAEVAAQYGRRDLTSFGADVRALIEQGMLIAGHEYVNAQRIRTLLRRDFDALWEEIDVLAVPTTPVTAPKRSDTAVQIGPDWEDVRIASTRLVRGMNFLGEPALSMPCGQASNGLPIGLQLIAKPWRDVELLNVAAVIENVTE